MSLEDELKKNTAALEANTAALLKTQAGGAAGTSNTKGNAATTGGAKITKEQVNAALVKVKDAKGSEAAKSIIADVAGVSKMADIKDAKFAAVISACEKALGDDGGGDTDDNL